MRGEVTFILGGARSGKTRHGLSLCERMHDEQGLSPIYIATGQAFDAEMEARIAAHKAERGPAWRTVEAPYELSEAIRRDASPGTCILVDCLTLWVTNLMLGGETTDLDAARKELVAALHETKGPVVIISNEVGQGIVPENALARRFRDEAGWTNQTIAAAADRVILVAAGLPLTLK